MQKLIPKIYAMDELERQYLIGLYNNRVSLLGETPAALGWSPTGQRTRYGRAVEFFGREALEGASLADYGCGIGDFYGFLAGEGIHAKYAGFDINPGLLEIARRRHPDASFGILDIDESGLPGVFDFSLICGVFNQRMEDAASAAKRCIEKMWARTAKALVFDALSEDAAGRDISLHYWSPQALFDFALTLPDCHRAVFEALDREVLVLCLERHPR